VLHRGTCASLSASSSTTQRPEFTWGATNPSSGGAAMKLLTFAILAGLVVAAGFLGVMLTLPG